MPSIYSMLDIGRWALQTSTSHLNTVSHNVANVNTEGYSRQQVVQVTQTPEKTGHGFYGRGVSTETVIQFVDELLAAQITGKVSDQQYADARLTQLRRLESLANEAGETGLGKELTEFFNAWQEVANNPESSAVREVLKETAINLTGRLQSIMDDVQTISRDLDTYISGAVSEANAACRRIADLNDQISQAETAGKSANDLRDERARQIDGLSKLMNIQWFEDATGNVTVVGGQGKTLVQSAYPAPNDPDPLQFGQSSDGSYVITWADSSLVMDHTEITGGKIGAWLEVRDSDIPELQEFMNDLSTNLIREVNLLHAGGAGLDKFTEVTGSYQSSSSSMAFNNADNELPFGSIVKNGTLDIWVYEAGTRKKHSIAVEPSDSLETLAAKLNAAVDPTGNNFAAVTSDNRLKLTSGAGEEFAFGGDTSNVLAALGINTFFHGSNANNIEVNQAIQDNVRLIAAGRIMADGEHALGDNTNALDLSDLKDEDTMNGNETFNEAVIAWSSELGTKVSSVEADFKFSQTATNQLLDQRDSVSAVNLDEEMVKMIQYQRSYQMAAKLITTTDELLATLLELKR